MAYFQGTKYARQIGSFPFSPWIFVQTKTPLEPAPGDQEESIIISSSFRSCSFVVSAQYMHVRPPLEKAMKCLKRRSTSYQTMKCIQISKSSIPNTSHTKNNDIASPKKKPPSSAPSKEVPIIEGHVSYMRYCSSEIYLLLMGLGRKCWKITSHRSLKHNDAYC